MFSINYIEWLCEHWHWHWKKGIKGMLIQWPERNIIWPQCSYCRSIYQEFHNGGYLVKFAGILSRYIWGKTRGMAIKPANWNNRGGGMLKFNFIQQDCSLSSADPLTSLSNIRLANILTHVLSRRFQIINPQHDFFPIYRSQLLKKRANVKNWALHSSSAYFKTTHSLAMTLSILHHYLCSLHRQRQPRPSINHN